MSEPADLVLELLRAMRGDVAAIRETLREHGYPLTRIESAVAGLRRDQASDAEGLAHGEARFDRISERLERIERRLGLIDSQDS